MADLDVTGNYRTPRMDCQSVGRRQIECQRSADARTADTPAQPPLHQRANGMVRGSSVTLPINPASGVAFRGMPFDDALVDTAAE